MPSWKPLTESELCTKFESRLRQIDSQAFFWKIWQGPLSRSGFPDHHLTIAGLTILLEAKRFPLQLTLQQEFVLRQLAAAGGAGGLLTLNKKSTHFIFQYICNTKGSEYKIVTSVPQEFTKKELVQGLLKHPALRKEQG